MGGSNGAVQLTRGAGQTAFHLCTGGLHLTNGLVFSSFFYMNRIKHEQLTIKLTKRISCTTQATSTAWSPEYTGPLSLSLSLSLCLSLSLSLFMYSSPFHLQHTKYVLQFSLVPLRETKAMRPKRNKRVADSTRGVFLLFRPTMPGRREHFIP